MSKRSHINLTTKLAAALCTIVRPDETGRLVPVISWDEAKKLTAKQVISRFEFDHYPTAHWLGGSSEHWNLVPRPRTEHRSKSARIDTPAAAKSKRILAKLNVVIAADATPKRQKPKRSWPKRTFAMQRGHRHVSQ